MMFGQSKLKGPIGRVAPYAVFCIFVVVFLEIAIRREPYPLFSTLIFGSFFMILGLLDFIRTRLWTYLILGLIWGTGTWHSLTYFVESPLSLASYLVHVFFSIFSLALAWPVILGNERLERNARRLFHLAAEDIQEAADGFTSRPYSAGLAEYTEDELLGFTRYLKAKHIVSSRILDKTVALTFSMGKSPLKEPDLTKISYVAFSPEGNISVHISEYDYKKYREKLTFDQLCASLGNVFKRFLEYYEQGLDKRILTELKSG